MNRQQSHIAHFRPLVEVEWPDKPFPEDQSSRQLLFLKPSLSGNKNKE
uniref:Uncharacterized protein n=1 Tax=Rhizophora mucronata TaxID=61149 RepID=A0A2P2IVJ3_RHIMU